jgi:hypothetical protein
MADAPAASKKAGVPAKKRQRKMRELLLQEIIASHDRKHGTDHQQGYLLCDDGSISTTKGGEWFLKRNLKPYRASINGHTLFELPERWREPPFTFAVVTEEEGVRLRELMTEWGGYGGMEDCTYEETCEGLTVMDKHERKVRRVNKI